MSLIDIMSYLITLGGRAMIAVYENKKSNWKIETSNMNEQISKYQDSSCICKIGRRLVNLEGSTSDYFNQDKNSLRSSLCVEIRLV